MMSWISDKLLGYRRVLFGTEELPERGALEIVGATVEDDPTNKRTVVTIGGGSGVSGSVDNVPAMASELVARDASGDADFHSIDVGVRVRVGVAADGGTYTQLQNVTPTAARQFTCTTTGVQFYEATGARKHARRWLPVVAETAEYAAADMQIVRADGAEVTAGVRLPASSIGEPACIIVRALAGSTLNVLTTGGDTIMDVASPYVQAAGSAAMYIDDGTNNWLRIIFA
jgi:hypothetical protein